MKPILGRSQVKVDLIRIEWLRLYHALKRTVTNYYNIEDLGTIFCYITRNTTRHLSPSQTQMWGNIHGLQETCAQLETVNLRQLPHTVLEDM